MSQFGSRYRGLAQLAFVSCCIILLGLLLKSTSDLLAQSFDAPQEWHPSFCVGSQICNTGDFDGDGDDDIVAFLGDDTSRTQPGNVYVSLSTRAGFADPQLWHPSFCARDQICTVGDFNGDGKDDIAYFAHDPAASDGLGQWWVSTSLGAMFATAQRWPNDIACRGENVCVAGDFNGDGTDDVAVLTTTQDVNGMNGTIHVVPPNTATFTDTVINGNAACISGETCTSADVNGDGVSDIVRFAGPASTQPGSAWVAFSTGTSFQVPQMLLANFCAGNDAVCTVGDFNGDQRSDLLRFQGRNNAGAVDVAFSMGTTFQPPVMVLQHFCTGGELCMVGEFNGDGIDDVIAFIRGDAANPRRGKVYVSVLKEIGPVGPLPPNTNPTATCTPGMPGCSTDPADMGTSPPPTMPPSPPGGETQTQAGEAPAAPTATCVPGTPGCTTGEVPGGDDF